MNKVKLGKYCKLQSGYAFKSKEFVNKGIPIIRIGNIQNGLINVDNNICYSADFLSDESNSQFVISKNDVLIAMSGATVGKIGIYKDANISLMNQRVGKFVCKEELYYKYLYYLMSYSSFQKQIINIATGCAQPNISGKQLESIIVPYCSIEKQKYIVKELDEIYEAIENRNKIKNELKEFIDSAYSFLFGDVIRNDKKFVMKNWNELLTIKNGKNQKNVISDNGKYPIYGSGGIIGRADKYLCEKDSIIVGRKGNINHPIFVRERFWNVDTAFGIEVGDDLDAIYFFKYCQLFNFQSYNKAVTIPSLTKKDLLKIEMPVPPMNLQKKFAIYFDTIGELEKIVEDDISDLYSLLETKMHEYFD